MFGVRAEIGQVSCAVQDRVQFVGPLGRPPPVRCSGGRTGKLSPRTGGFPWRLALAEEERAGVAPDSVSVIASRLRFQVLV